jgi:hypothetical protein
VPSWLIVEIGAHHAEDIRSRTNSVDRNERAMYRRMIDNEQRFVTNWEYEDGMTCSTLCGQERRCWERRKVICEIGKITRTFEEGATNDEQTIVARCLSSATGTLQTLGYF